MLNKIVRKCIDDLNSQQTGAIRDTIAKLKNAGAIRNIHVGKTNFTQNEMVEWYAGQLLDVLEDGKLHCVNSIINEVDRFCPRC